MPWDKDFQQGERYQLIHTLAKLKAEHAALRSGSMKILYAEADVFALARFLDAEAFVCIISTEDSDKTIRLPLGAIGATQPDGNTDLFGSLLHWETADAHAISLSVKAHQSCLFRCQIG